MVEEFVVNNEVQKKFRDAWSIQNGGNDHCSFRSIMMSESPSAASTPCECDILDHIIKVFQVHPSE